MGEAGERPAETVILRPYTPDDAGGVAVMWEESRPAWPPGFLGSSENTAESIAMEEETSGSIFTMLATAGQRVVGYCRTTPYGGEPDADYVALVNVVPDMHGRGIGKRLLLDSVERSAGMGFARLDLHTWSSNLKAVPLYKKTGFFWVPDTMVYMQNYMPLLLGRPELREMIGDGDWYSMLRMDLSIRQDLGRTESGREVFTYRLETPAGPLEVEIDVKGRIPSAVRAPGFSASLERSAGTVLTGRPVSVSFRGDMPDGELPVRCHEFVDAPSSLSVREGRGDMEVTHRPVEVLLPERDRAPRAAVLTEWREPLLLGLGLDAARPLSVISPPVRMPVPGSRGIDVWLRRPGGDGATEISMTLDGDELPGVERGLRDLHVQSVRLPLPELPPGAHLLDIAFTSGGVGDLPERTLLLRGPLTGGGAPIVTSRRAFMVGDGFVAEVRRMGGALVLWGWDDEGDMPVRLGGLQVLPGPPYWNSDLPHSIWDLAADGGGVVATTGWSSRPGMVCESRYRLDPAGFVAASLTVRNLSDEERRVAMSARWRPGGELHPPEDLLPVGGDAYRGRRVYAQTPSWDEDLPREVSGLSAPFLASAGRDRSLMVRFDGWPKLSYDAPQTEDMAVPARGEVSSPEVLLVPCEGGMGPLLRRARALGMDTGDPPEAFGLTRSDHRPVMRSGRGVTLRHPLRGRRRASIRLSGRSLSEGHASASESLRAVLRGEGAATLELSLAGRTERHPVFLVPDGAPSVRRMREGDDLVLENGRLALRMGTGGFGNVHSLELDGAEQLRSSWPEPGEYAWDRPWFGGVRPRVGGRGNRPVMLFEHEVEAEELDADPWELGELGWRLRWDIDGRLYGSLSVCWEVSMLPGVPVLRTLLRVGSPAGGFLRAEDAIGCFPVPGGAGEEVFMTCEREPLLCQGRDHSGAWLPAGSWAEVGGPGDAFVTARITGSGHLFGEDYGELGCNIAVYGERPAERPIGALWIFGRGPEDRAVASALRCSAEWSVRTPP